MDSVKETIVYVLLVIIVGTKESTAIVCPAGAFLFEGSCYKFHTGLKNWHDAQQYCKTTDHGNLAVVRTESFYRMFQRLYTDHGSNSLWVGATDPHQNRHFVWVNGASCCNHWLPGEPNNSGNIEYCVNLQKDGSANIGYNDINCANGMQFVCQTFSCHNIANCTSGQVECNGKENTHHRCKQCSPGHYVGSWGHGCLACHVDHCMEGHVLCTGSLQSDQVCSLCRPGYYWNTTLHTCEAACHVDHCMDGYVDCNGPLQTDQVCTLCTLGYYWNTTLHTCESCHGVDHCVNGYLKCIGPLQSDQLCSQCEVGYYWNFKLHNCEECKQIQGCVHHMCTDGSSSVCLECNQSRILVSHGTSCFNFVTHQHMQCHSKCAVIFETMSTWDTAKAVCERRHGHLYVPTDGTDDSRLRIYVTTVLDAIHPTALWIGGHMMTDNSVQWSDNIKTSADSWVFNKPTATTEALCMALDPGEKFRWTAYNCNSERYFVCEETTPYVPDMVEYITTTKKPLAPCHVDHCMEGYGQCAGLFQSDQVCSLCTSGYYWNTTFYTCEVCHVDNCMEGYIQCNGPLQSDRLCSQCTTGYYWNAALHMCEDKQFLSCHGVDHCVNGYLQCIGPLQSDQFCSQCEVGYYWNVKLHYCEECQQIQGCVNHRCTNGSSSVCLECAQSRILLGQGTVCMEFDSPEHMQCHSKCAVVFEKMATWDIAKAVCERRHGHLYVPTDGTDDIRLRNYVTTVLDAIHPTSLWIGGHLLTDNSVQWSDNIKSSADSWVFNKPTATTEALCMALDPGEQFRWTAYNCNSERYFVCEETTLYDPDIVG